MKLLSHSIVFAAMAGIACASGLANAADPAPSADSKPRAEMNALRVIRDAATGELRAPTAEELKALLEAERVAREARLTSRARSTGTYAADVLPEQKAVVRHPNGMVSVRLGQDSLTAVKVVPVDGKPHVVHDAAAQSQPAAQEK